MVFVTGCHCCQFSVGRAREYMCVYKHIYMNFSVYMIKYMLKIYEFIPQTPIRIWHICINYSYSAPLGLKYFTPKCCHCYSLHWCPSHCSPTFHAELPLPLCSCWTHSSPTRPLTPFARLQRIFSHPLWALTPDSRLLLLPPAGLFTLLGLWDPSWAPLFSLFRYPPCPTETATLGCLHPHPLIFPWASLSLPLVSDCPH